jgi:hypothetical protein
MDTLDTATGQGTLVAPVNGLLLAFDGHAPDVSGSQAAAPEPSSGARLGAVYIAPVSLADVWQRAFRPRVNPTNATTLPGCLKFPLKQHGTRSHDAGNHSRLAAQQNAVTDLPKYFSFVNVLKTKQLPVCRRMTPSLTTQPHVMFEPAFANLSSP